MAGKKEIDADKSEKAVNNDKKTLAKILTKTKTQRKNKFSKASDTLESKNMKQSNNLGMPSVMVTKSDGDALIELISNQNLAENLDAKVQITIFAENMILNSEFFGNFDYPKLWMRQNIGNISTFDTGISILFCLFFYAHLVFVLGRGNWGTFMTLISTNTENAHGDWQLYLMNKRDMSVAQMTPTIDLQTTGRQTKNTISTIISNPVEIYSFLISRKCPNVFSSIDGTVHLKVP
jgi:hypothetical protein